MKYFKLISKKVLTNERIYLQRDRPLQLEVYFTPITRRHNYNELLDYFRLDPDIPFLSADVFN